jgi:hypothetical protein
MASQRVSRSGPPGTPNRGHPGDEQMISSSLERVVDAQRADRAVTVSTHYPLGTDSYQLAALDEPTYVAVDATCSLRRANE